MDRKVTLRIHDEIRNSGNLDKEYVVGLVKELDERPDIQRLVEQHYKSKADRIISSFKDENGIRDCFAIRDSQNKTKYVDISKPNLLSKNEIEEIRTKQEKLKKKKEEVLLKVSMACQVKDGQIRLEDYERTLRKELVGEGNVK